MTATELTESTKRGVWGGKSISVFSVLPVAESYKKQIQFSIIELKRAGFNVLQQQNIKVYYENQVVGNYFVDIIADQIILEIKSAEGLKEENKAQLINYIKTTDKEVGLLLNFGRTPEFKRVIFTNDRKE